MKHIKKGEEPQIFIDWKAIANENWSPTYKDLRGAEKQALAEALLRDQGGICCYCENTIKGDFFHIEHLKPQSDFPDSQLDYANLVCSCQRNIKAGIPHHCGNTKGDWYDENLFISPLDTTCETRFAFLADGNIRPTNPKDKAAKETIKRLALDIASLNEDRKSVLDTFYDKELTPQDLSNYVEKYLMQNDDGTYRQFWTTIKYLFNS